AKYRNELSEGMVITKGQEHCLYVFPTQEFRRVTEVFSSAPVTAKAVRDYSRVFFASASDESCDKQGRVTVPPPLRAYAGLERDCVVIGANTRLEIWAARTWAAYEAEQEQAFAQLSEEELPGVPLTRCGCRRSEQPTVHTLAERGPDRVFSEHPDASWRDFPGARSSTPFHQKVDNGGRARRRPDRGPGRPREAHRRGVLSARFAATDGETATAWRRNAWGTSGGTVVPKKGQSRNTRSRGTSKPGFEPHEPVSTLFTYRSCSTASWNCSHLPCPVPAPYWWTAPWDWEATPKHSSRPAPNCV